MGTKIRIATNKSCTTKIACCSIYFSTAIFCAQLTSQHTTQAMRFYASVMLLLSYFWWVLWIAHTHTRWDTLFSDDSKCVAYFVEKRRITNHKKHGDFSMFGSNPRYYRGFAGAIVCADIRSIVHGCNTLNKEQIVGFRSLSVASSCWR